ncbi:hypothetical protein M1525_01400 [Patescibacteria group bacterium]|nr:hypothetical protein [Patescibacteria group bacterium]
MDATKLNAKLLLFSFLAKRKNSAAELNQSNPENKKMKVLIAGGERTGRSTDYPTLAWAKKSQSEKIIFISNTLGLYNRDPRKNTKAKLIRKINWSGYQLYLNQTKQTNWSAGLHLPIDPVAAAFGSKNRLNLYLVGPNLKNIENLIKNKNFIGTIVSA